VKKFSVVLCVLFVSALILAGVSVSARERAQQRPTDIAIVSASPVGTVFFIVSGQTSILNSNMEGVIFTNEASTGAPNVNGPFVDQDFTYMAYIPFCGLYAGVRGMTERGFRAPLDNVGFIYGGHNLFLYFITLAESDITSIADLAGRRISIPQVGTTGYFQTIAVLDAHGIDHTSDLTAVPMGFTDAADGLRDGHLVAIAINGGVVQATVAELDATRNIRFLSLDDEEAVEKLRVTHPYWVVNQFPEEIYAQQPDNFYVINGGTAMIANLDLCDDLVYEITKTLLTNVDTLAAVHRDGADWNVERSVELMNLNLVPVHPGAERYFRSIGAIQ